MEIETQQIELVKTQVSKALAAVEIIVIDSDENMLEAGDILKRVKTVGKMIKERKEAITKPLNESLKSIRALFSPFESDYEKAEEIISTKMLSYQKSQEAEAEKIRLENQTRLEDTSTSHDAHRYDDMKVVPEVIKKSVDFHTRTTKDFKIVDKTKLPFEYLIADEVAIRKAMHAGVQLQGVEYFDKKTIV